MLWLDIRLLYEAVEDESTKACFSFHNVYTSWKLKHN